MNIAVNTRLLLKGRLEGIGWFTYETLKRITKSHPEHNFFFIFDRDYDDSFIFSENVFPIVLKPKTRHPILWYLWFEYQIPRVLKKINADLFISLDGFLSLRSNLAQISVIHDINFAHNPEHLPYLVSKFYNYFFPKYAKKALALASVSEYSRKDIAETYNIDINKIQVCYNACNVDYTPVDKAVKESVRKEFSLGEEYFVFVGSLNPRKNVHGLLKSFDRYKEISNSNHKLLIIGGKMHSTSEITRVYNTMRHRSDVYFLGRLSGKDLHRVLASSLALVYIPFFEGFGIPLVEAMNCDIPIVSGNTTSLPEVVGDAAVICSPYDENEVAQAMLSIAKDDILRNNLIQKGRVQAKKFSWDKSAEKLWEIIKSSGIITN